jgi:protein TonB
MVRLISLTPPKPPEPIPPPPRPVVLPQAPVLQIPVVELPTVPPPEVKVAAAPAPTITAVAAAAPAPPPPLAPPMAAPRVLPPSAVHYIVAPPLEVPLASRRLGETGTVVLRVLIGRDGMPKQITVHQSSGFARLDEQAVSAMWQARFKPHHENGQPIEAIALAACSYELD